MTFFIYVDNIQPVVSVEVDSDKWSRAKVAVGVTDLVEVSAEVTGPNGTVTSA